MEKLPGLPEAWPITKESQSLLPEYPEAGKSVNEPRSIQIAHKPPTISRCGLSELIADCFSMISFAFSIVFRMMNLWPKIFNKTTGPNVMRSRYRSCLSLVVIIPRTVRSSPLCKGEPFPSLGHVHCIAEQPMAWRPWKGHGILSFATQDGSKCHKRSYCSEDWD